MTKSKLEVYIDIESHIYAVMDAVDDMPEEEASESLANCLERALRVMRLKLDEQKRKK